MLLKVLSHFIMKIKIFMKYIKEGVLKYLKISMKFLNISKRNISSWIRVLVTDAGWFHFRHRSRWQDSLHLRDSIGPPWSLAGLSTLASFWRLLTRTRVAVKSVARLCLS